MDWLQNRNVKFAVGCTVLILIVWWLLTGSTLRVAEAVEATEPAEGETRSVSGVVAIVWPIFFELMLFVGGSVIAFSLGVWDWVANKLNGQKSAPKPLTVNDVAQDLLRAVAMGDQAAIETASRAIRKEYAPGQLGEAIAAGDFAAAKQLLSEIEELSK